MLAENQFWEVNRAFSGAHKPKQATSILGLRHGVFIDKFIFRHISGHFSPLK